jgi:cobalt-precorrin 5A hydrolase
MKTAIIALTKNGTEFAIKIGPALAADLYLQNGFGDQDVIHREGLSFHPIGADFKGKVQEIFRGYDAIIFIMACGIVVRSIAPYLKDKRSDPAVVVVDELGRFAVSLLSGHIGGANRLAERVAALTGGVPVITTATDLHGAVAFDELAAANGCVIENIHDLKYISSELVNGGKVGFFADCGTAGLLPSNIEPYLSGQACKYAVAVTNSLKTPVQAEKILYLRPGNLIVGLGCKKGKTKQEIGEAVLNFLERNHKSALSVKCIASIDLKANESGILEFCHERNIDFRTFTTDEIKLIEHQFASSEFVKKTTGVGSVAESCAMLAGNHGRLICPKTVYGGITLALAEEEQVFTL